MRVPVRPVWGHYKKVLHDQLVDREGSLAQSHGQRESRKETSELEYNQPNNKTVWDYSAIYHQHLHPTPIVDKTFVALQHYSCGTSQKLIAHPCCKWLLCQQGYSSSITNFPHWTKNFLVFVLCCCLNSNVVAVRLRPLNAAVCFIKWCISH